MERPSETGALRSIGKYHIVTRLADGAMSSVYKGHDPSTGATVAIKLAATALANDKVLLKRFEQEYRSTSNLCHPNIVRGLEFGWEESRPYIVMELVDGEDMWARIQRLGRLTEAEAVSYIVQVARGLHEAHKNGIIHRDIKPDNILLTMDGQAKLTDLGLSKDLEADMDLTRPEKGIGTPNFIAPEQFGDAKHAGVRCDIYSLGATLYMALTGQLPFAGANLSTILKRKLANDLEAPRKLVPSLSEHIDIAVRRALQTDPDRRYASCTEFIAALSGKSRGSRANSTRTCSSPSRRQGAESKSPGRERRAAVRYECTLPTCCTINQSLHPDMTECRIQFNARVCDLSVSGIGLVLSRRFEPRSVLTVDLTSSAGDMKRTREMRVVRVALAGREGWFLAGIFTENLSKEELRRLL
jgi:serine/threonine protein kinase